MTSEEKKAEKAIQSTEDSGEGDKSSAASIVERAESVAKRMAEENERYEANLRRQEEIMAKQTLGGRATIEKPVQKEESAKEYKDRVMRGEI